MNELKTSLFFHSYTVFVVLHYLNMFMQTIENKKRKQGDETNNLLHYLLTLVAYCI